MKFRLVEDVESSLYLYHATSKENAEQINKNGLLVNPPTHNWDDIYCDGMIFLAFDASVAEDYVYAQDDVPDDVVVYKIKLNSLNPDYFGYDWNNRCEYHDEINSCVYYKDIPAYLLKICDADSEPEQVFDDFEGTALYDILYQTFDEEVETNKEHDDLFESKNKVK